MASQIGRPRLLGNFKAPKDVRDKEKAAKALKVSLATLYRKLPQEAGV